MSASVTPPPTPAVALPARKVVGIYQDRSKHRFAGYAAGPTTLDWDARPAPFRHYSGAPVIALPLACSAMLSEAPARPAVAELASLGALLHLSFGLTAWKTLGPDRWAVRANPSSGNLHPVEVYVLVAGVPGLADGLYHYLPERHALELRAQHPRPFAPGPALAVGLSTVMWREAWKYGERAFRYCQLDTGHALGALGYASALLGWRPVEQLRIGSETLARVLGADREDDFPGRRADVCREEPELLLALDLGGGVAPHAPSALRAAAVTAVWQGVASVVDPHPMFRWPLIDEVALASRRPDDSGLPAIAAVLPRAQPAARILGRRSAQRFDAAHVMSAAAFGQLLAALVGEAETQLSLFFFVHRVEGMEAGVYLLPRGPWGPALVDGLGEHAAPVSTAEEGPLLHLRTLAPLALRRVARSLHCHQDIASTACLALGMLAPLGPLVARHPAAYRDVLREAGLLGQRLYLEAEAMGLRGTGIGCFFDDPVREAAAITTPDFQSLYHFTIGMPVDDERIETTPAYPALAERSRP
ncbi:MAG: SagB/ThcOx family dehydrogenase [Zoogloea sp.]|nr:SagB/ThcOx family dehydrogenase [Zoogloea sp.]